MADLTPNPDQQLALDKLKEFVQKSLFLKAMPVPAKPPSLNSLLTGFTTRI